MADSMIEYARSYEDSKTIIIDTETTGLDPKKDEVLALAIVDTNGEVLFDHLIKPQKRKRWPEATKINGIRWSDVASEKTLLEYENELAKYFDGSYLIVGYNVNFDLEMLQASGIPMPTIYRFDVMAEYARVHGRYSEWQEKRLYAKLAECATFYGYERFDSHNALQDAVATAFCFQRLLDDEEYVQLCEQEKAEKEAKAAQDKRDGRLVGFGCAAAVVLAIIVLAAFFSMLFSIFS